MLLVAETDREANTGAHLPEIVVAHMSALSAEVIAEQIQIKDTDYKLDAPLGELGRWAYSLRDFLCDQIESDAASLRAELLKALSAPEAERPTLIQALCTELLAAWKRHSALDARIVGDRTNSASDQLQKEMDAQGEMIRDLERAIASTRIQSSSDLTVALLLFSNDMQDNWSDAIQREAIFELWRDSIAEYHSRTGSGCELEICRRYFSKSPTPGAMIKDAAE